MNVIETFDTLIPPETANRNLFNAVSLNDFAFAKVAISNEGFPVILISSATDNTLLSQKNFRLKYLELTHNLECKVSEGGNKSYAIYTVIIFKSDQPFLQRYFLGIAETLIKSLSVKPTQKEIAEIFKAFVEIFRSLSDAPTKTIHGLWSELFVIETSKQLDTLLNYWHCKPEEKFDFNADDEKLEVKSSNSLERIHTFASEQLNPLADKQVIIASVFLKQITHGQSIADLANSIQHKAADNDLAEKMFAIISATLGNTLEQSIKIKFDYDLAKNSLRFYRHQDIHKIERVNIPNSVSEVHYKSDLREVVAVDIQNLKGNGHLFKAI
jgi:hypothetical protein